MERIPLLRHPDGRRDGHPDRRRPLQGKGLPERPLRIHRRDPRRNAHPRGLLHARRALGRRLLRTRPHSDHLRRALARVHGTPLQALDRHGPRTRRRVRRHRRRARHRGPRPVHGAHLRQQHVRQLDHGRARKQLRLHVQRLRLLRLADHVAAHMLRHLQHIRLLQEGPLRHQAVHHRLDVRDVLRGLDLLR